MPEILHIMPYLLDRAQSYSIIVCMEQQDHKKIHVHVHVADWTNYIEAERTWLVVSVCLSHKNVEFLTEMCQEWS